MIKHRLFEINVPKNIFIKAPSVFGDVDGWYFTSAKCLSVRQRIVLTELSKENKIKALHQLYFQPDSVNSSSISSSQVCCYELVRIIK